MVSSSSSSNSGIDSSKAQALNADNVRYQSILEELESLLQRRIVYLDGAMGTTIQGYKLDESDYRGERFANWESDLKGANDLLSLTQPDLTREIHLKFLNAGSDIIETNTFNANRISLADYGMESMVREHNIASARLAREAVDQLTRENPDRKAYVAGAIGPTNRTTSISPDVNRPEYRAVTYTDLVEVYYEQAAALLEGGVDVLLIETVFDTLNSKAAIYAALKLMDETGIRIPLMLSFTITDKSGRTLSGQTVEAYWNSVRHAPLLSIGINCALGPEEMRPYIEELSELATIYVSCYPNAGLPDPMSATGYPETPESMAPQLKDWADSGYLNILRIVSEQRDQIIHAGRISMLGQFAASLAHELGQPLGAILNNVEAAQLLLRDDRSANAAELRAIVNDIAADDARAGAVLDGIRALVMLSSRAVRDAFFMPPFAITASIRILILTS